MGQGAAYQNRRFFGAPLGVLKLNLYLGRLLGAAFPGQPDSPALCIRAVIEEEYGLVEKGAGCWMD